MKQLQERSLLCCTVALVRMLQDDYHLPAISPAQQNCAVLQNAISETLLLKREGECGSEKILRRSEPISEVERGEENCKSGRKLWLQAVPWVERSPAWNRKFLRLPKSWLTHLKTCLLSIYYVASLFSASWWKAFLKTMPQSLLWLWVGRPSTEQQFSFLFEPRPGEGCPWGEESLTVLGEHHINQLINEQW